jgi:hypothetical protein
MISAEMNRENDEGPICAVISFELSLASILGKVICQRNPGKLALGPGLIGQGGSAFATESAQHVRRRSVRSGLALNEPEFVSIKPRPRNKRRATCAPASSTVAMCDPVRFAVCTIAHGATETTSLDSSHGHLPAVADISTCNRPLSSKFRIQGSKICGKVSR